MGRGVWTEFGYVRFGRVMLWLLFGHQAMIKHAIKCIHNEQVVYADDVSIYFCKCAGNTAGMLISILFGECNWYLK